METHQKATYEINPNNLLVLNSNTTALICSVTSAGAIYYSAPKFMHYGCNSTNWNALY